MKIIKPGKDVDTWTGKCHNCDCEIECAKSETEWYADLGKICGGFYGVKCPNCSTIIRVHQKREKESTQPNTETLPEGIT